jgi:hypothetical protein
MARGAKSMAQRARRTFSFVFGGFRFIEHRATSTFKIQYWIFDIPLSFLIFEYLTEE